MSEWWTYRLSDLILFSRDVYYRTFALYHHGIWPAHLLFVVALVLAMLACRRSGDDVTRGRIVVALLALCWLWIAVAFQLHRYATINWAATYFAGAFVLQSVLLGWLGVKGCMVLRPQAIRVLLAGLAVLLVATPFVGLITGRQWDQVELVGLTPDPTAAATIFLLQLSTTGIARFALVIPLAWSLVGGFTLYALHSPEAWWSWLSALIALSVFRSHRRSIT